MLLKIWTRAFVLLTTYLTVKKITFSDLNFSFSNQIPTVVSFEITHYFLLSYLLENYVNLHICLETRLQINTYAIILIAAAGLRECGYIREHM
jgi:hypothetical protein